MGAIPDKNQEMICTKEWKSSIPTLILKKLNVSNKCTDLVLLQPACDVIGHSPRIVNNREMGVLQKVQGFSQD